MKERGIIFNAEMVRAILDERKTQTRRIVKNVMPDNGIWLKKPTKTRSGTTTHVLDAPKHNLCPLGKIGDHLWVRETFNGFWLNNSEIQEIKDGVSSALELCSYKADYPDGSKSVEGWTPSIHMPRWASRITLEITNIQVEKLQDISKQDAISEGAPQGHYSIDIISKRFGFPDFSRSWFAQIWMDIYGEDSWSSNPWVWVIEFKRI